MTRNGPGPGPGPELDKNINQVKYLLNRLDTIVKSKIYVHAYAYIGTGRRIIFTKKVI